MSARKSDDRAALLSGTLDLLILRTLLAAPLHGHGIGKAIRRTSEDLLLVEHGSLYPALYRLERKRWISSRWETTPKGRPMKFYRLTAAGRRQLRLEESKWERFARAMRLVLGQEVE
jgi:transcriptional regulator